MTTARFAAVLLFGVLASCAISNSAIHVDLADVVSSGAVEPVEGITSSAQPDVAALEVFAASGYVAVVDIRGPKEKRGLDEKAVVEKLGLDYVAFPIMGGKDVTFAKARALDELLSGYDGPVLMHCGSGNRVGAILALRESLNGASDEEAIKYGKRAGLTGLQRVVTERLGSD